MTRTHHRIRLRSAAAACALAAAATAGGLATAVPAAAATAHVVVSPTTADPGYATTLTVSGTGFQSVKGGFGGIYVLFGVVNGNWRPSQGGIGGSGYAYVPDSQTKDNHGFQKFVSFPDGSTLAEANGGVIAADGSWHTTLVVPGATFTAAGTGGKARKVDCTTEQCGVITIGAHGVVSAPNETFTPVRFSAAKTAAKPATTQKPAESEKKSSTGGGTAGTPSAKPTATATRSAAAASPSPDAGTATATPSSPAAATSAPATAPSTTPLAATLHTSSASGLRIAGIAVAAVVIVAGGVPAVRRLRKRGGPAAH